MTFFSSLAWTGISFLLFTVLVAVISAWKTRDEQLDTAEGYFLAGRGLPGVVIAGSLLLTNLSAEQLVGLNGQSWKTNMGPIAWEVGSMFTLLVLAYYFLPKYLKMGAMTIPSLMEERYGKGTKTMFSLVIVVMYSILNLPVILYSGAVVFEQIFDISGISKSPAVFDNNTLRWMNAEYMKKLSPEAFFAKAEPVLKTAVTNPAVDLRAVAALVQPRCEILSDLPERVDFIDRLPEYSTELYVHKKSKTTLENSLSSLQAILPVLEGLQTWTNESLYEALVALAAKLEVKNSVVLWPLRVAVSGKASTPGGATELCALLGKEESLARIRTGIELLSK